MRSVIIVILFSIFSSFNLSSQTIIPPGNVSGTWSVAKSTYQVEGEITVPDDSTLILEPGVEIIFTGHYALNVQGRILASGTQSDSILFTVGDTTGFSDPDTSLGGWYGIRFIDSQLCHYCHVR